KVLILELEVTQAHRLPQSRAEHVAVLIDTGSRIVRALEEQLEGEIVSHPLRARVVKVQPPAHNMELTGEKDRSSSRRQRVSSFGKVSGEGRAHHGTGGKKRGAGGGCGEGELVRLPNRKVVDGLVVAPLLG